MDGWVRGVAGWVGGYQFFPTSAQQVVHGVRRESTEMEGGLMDGWVGGSGCLSYFPEFSGAQLVGALAAFHTFQNSVGPN